MLEAEDVLYNVCDLPHFQAGVDEADNDRFYHQPKGKLCCDFSEGCCPCDNFDLRMTT